MGHVEGGVFQGRVLAALHRGGGRSWRRRSADAGRGEPGLDRSDVRRTVPGGHGRVCGGVSQVRGPRYRRAGREGRDLLHRLGRSGGGIGGARVFVQVRVRQCTCRRGRRLAARAVQDSSRRRGRASAANLLYGALPRVDTPDRPHGRRGRGDAPVHGSRSRGARPARDVSV